MTLLQATDQVFCAHCLQWHPVELRNAEDATPGRSGGDFVYTPCAAGIFYVGTLGTSCRHPTRQPPLWTLRKDIRRLECCLRSCGELGWELYLYRNALLYTARGGLCSTPRR